MVEEEKKKYIDMDKIAFHSVEWCGTKRFMADIDEVDEIPGEDVVPVIHARWLSLGDSETTANCSNCNAMVFEKELQTPYCPYCGAKMDKPIETLAEYFNLSYPQENWVKWFLKRQYFNLGSNFLTECRKHPDKKYEEVPEALEAYKELEKFEDYVQKWWGYKFDLDTREFVKVEK